jgi:ribosomal protein S18 acetylase RimI-like enzyme
MFLLRPAAGLDIDALHALDVLARADAHRRELITRAVAQGQCWVSVSAGGPIAGYGVMDYSFFENGFVAMLYIAPGYRRQGAGRRLLQHLGGQCQTAKLFTSTNLSNLPMQALLAQAGYQLSGVVHNLDEGDPELVYVKYLGQRRMP